MTNALIVGGDRLGNLPQLLEQYNIHIFSHITGRETSHQKKSLTLSPRVQLVILLTDFLGHNVMRAFRGAALKEGLPVMTCKRSLASMQRALDQSGFCKRQGSCDGCPLNPNRAAGKTKHQGACR